MPATSLTWVTEQDVLAAIHGSDLMEVAGSGVAAGLVRDLAGQVESKLSRKVLVSVTDEVCEVFPSGMVVTRHRPVISVVGTTVEARDGLAHLAAATPYTGEGMTVTLDYEAGMADGRLDSLKGLVIERSIRELVKIRDDARGVTGISEEGHSDDYIPAGWLDSEKETLEALRRRVGA